MYYLVNAEDKIRIPSSMMNMDVKKAATKILRDEYERRVLKNIGLILAIDNVEIVSDGIVIPGDQHIYYTAKFDALVFKPMVNEVFKGDVREIVDFGAFVTIGPFDGLLHLSQISGEKFHYDKKSKALTSKSKKSIKKGDTLLFKISTVSMKSSTDVKIGLTMRSEGLGKVEWLEEKKKKEKKG